MNKSTKRDCPLVHICFFFEFLFAQEIFGSELCDVSSHEGRWGWLPWNLEVEEHETSEEAVEVEVETADDLVGESAAASSAATVAAAEDPFTDDPVLTFDSDSAIYLFL